MMNNEKIYYGDEILDTIDECYFAPSRDKGYPSLEIKYAAQCALLRLWNMYLFELGDEVYYNQDIRRIVFEEMLPEHLDNAVQLCIKLGKTNDLEYFARMIFLQVIGQAIEYEAILKSVIVCRRYNTIKILAEVSA
ncbi:MAG: hypothetical protein IJE62_04695 [Clostridia bacterium]|nr:hypothetical protein [Clostridia bacterium]